MPDLLYIASLTLVSLIASVLLAMAGVGSAAAVTHLALAVGIVPLIFAAMIHFVPVLTRTGDPQRWIARLPVFGQICGLLAVLAMQGVLSHPWLYLAIILDLLLAAMLFNWMAGRVRSTIGSPHPGWRWYGAALGCLMLALLAVLLTGAWPHHWRELRLFHIHMNSIGLLGLAALGTLPVLLPTVLGKPDPEASGWLHRRLWLVAGGALVVATGAAVVWPFGAPGAALVLVAALSLIGQWMRRYGGRALLADGISALLLAAVCGLMLCLFAGLAHAARLLPAQPTLFAWGVGFLLPLVSGALGQLLPVWRWPGPVTPERLLMRSKLAAGGGWRAVLFLAAAMVLLTGQAPFAWFFLGPALLIFLVNLLRAVRVRRSTR